MTEITICGHKLPVKDYHCARNGDCFAASDSHEYIKKEELRLWLYVNITDRCNANCPFCVSGASAHNNAVVDLEQYKKAIEIAAPYIYGISFTGGEPLLYPELLNDLVSATAEVVPPDLEIDIATNGTNLDKLVNLPCFDRISSVHISRHVADDVANRELMGFAAPSAEKLKSVISALQDPGKIVFNCVMQKGGVENCQDVAKYLDFAISVGVRNSSFISMFHANEYCRQNYISANTFPIICDSDCDEWNREHPNAMFHIWNRYNDHAYCRCMSGSYHNAHGHTRFYFRCPGNEQTPDYCRQLVYTADNFLQDGFGTGRAIVWDGNMRF